MTPNTQHTPGPWKAYNADNGRIFKHWRIKGCAMRNDPPFAIIDSGGKILPEYEAANARLIAAAPSMLEALKSAVSYLEANRPKGKIREIFTQLNEYENGVLKPARAAILQAEGGAK